ncbi:hypothetical protein AGMMS50218_02370 [Actinomycetota bacterium]|nr:hypothetical protein AGMMS50218_02370 [Actinomycetota bacterium]
MVLLGCAPCSVRGSALALLVTQVLADHLDATVPADDLALVADLLDAGLDLHCVFLRRRGARERTDGVLEW